MDTCARLLQLELGYLGDQRAIEGLARALKDREIRVVLSSALSLTKLGDQRGAIVLTSLLQHSNREKRQTAVGFFAEFLDRIDGRLLSHDFSGRPPWLDAQEPISADRVESAALTCQLSFEEVRSRYHSLATKCGLKLSWVPGGD